MNETREDRLKEYYENPNICLCCGKVIKVEGKNGIADTRVKKFCNKSCSATYNNKLTKRKQKIKHYCLDCGEELVGRQTKFCNNTCYANYKYKEYIKRWKNGEETGVMGAYGTIPYLKRYLLEKYNGKCCKCGWHEINTTTGKTPLELHHIDGDYSNNKEDNLALLCPNCHSLTSTYKSLNTGKGRKERAKYLLPV